MGEEPEHPVDAKSRAEVQLASKILNTMTSLGMPDSYRVK
jgi:hypothetical protein